MQKENKRSAQKAGVPAGRYIAVYKGLFQVRVNSSKVGSNLDSSTEGRVS